MSRSLAKRVTGLVCAAGLVLGAQAGTSSRTDAADLVGLSPEEEAWVLLAAVLVGGVAEEFRQECSPCTSAMEAYYSRRAYAGASRGQASTNYDEILWRNVLRDSNYVAESLIQRAYGVTDGLGPLDYQNFFRAVEYNADHLRSVSNGAWTPSSLIFHPGGGSGGGEGGND